MNMSFPAVQPHSPPLNSVVSLTHRPSPVSSHQSAPAHHPHPIPFIFSPGCEPQVAGDISLRHAKAVLEEVDSAPFLDVSHPGFVHGLLEVALIGFLLAKSRSSQVRTYGSKMTQKPKSRRQPPSPSG